jgi:hypothetical protein
MISMALLGYVLWRATIGGGVDVLQTLFWGAFPDLFAFIPIGLASRDKQWPSWGATIYNLVHTLILWAGLFGILWYVSAMPYWPLLGWLLHITADRAFGYGLRSRNEASLTGPSGGT